MQNRIVVVRTTRLIRTHLKRCSKRRRPKGCNWSFQSVIKLFLSVTVQQATNSNAFDVCLVGDFNCEQEQTKSTVFFVGFKNRWTRIFSVEEANITLVTV